MTAPAAYVCDEAEARALTYAEARELTDRIKEGLLMRKRPRQTGVTKRDARPHVVYRAYDRDGLLLYVGISVAFMGRTTAHKRSAWWTQVSRIDIEHVPDRASALALEARWIALFLPTYNRSAGQA